MSFLDYLVVLSTLGTVVFSWTYLLLGRENGQRELDREEIEERIMELMGKFRYMSANRLELLERKTQEIRRLIEEANTVMSKLMVKMSEMERLELPRVEITEEKTVREEQKTQKEPEDDTEKDAGIEKKIVSMYDRGFSEIDIAKKLGVTVGEVRLILQLFKRNVG
ncbi:MAG: Uncharacterized protein XD64_1065 [Thermotoga sp. 47_83]|jgi:uncharacterized membrane-anchored protein YhcB (DUF1043 family)|uniref:Uncharacterized protein n=2 Tax=Thermotoga petrophila TaxID=93929 RepID=D2C5Y9_THEP2|nr:DUF6115 domain-containing protein [Thermotoga petrophila]KUK33108.1 MAG: Uncharacterized protein XD64_1065 [Thermotoga sp. 47_83]MDK2898590.1 hypothetical protein [Thermotoga sp.]ADA66375.1 conserved hypothetical protein [Thermotoga petrophila RKU-10]KUK22998.1 MAG: Uncharacterized protein XD57_0899 [Thermotoga petrophila]HBU00513.1 hypothetical protein [Thermotoga petrophila]